MTEKSSEIVPPGAALNNYRNYFFFYLLKKLLFLQDLGTGKITASPAAKIWAGAFLRAV